MSSLFGIGANGAASFYNGVATQSLRFAYTTAETWLARTPNAGNRKTHTLSVWVKRSKLSASQNILEAKGSGDTGNVDIWFDANDRLEVSGSSTYWRTTTRRFRDVSSWYHIMIVTDTTDGTAADRLKIYVNGTRETSFVDNNHYSQNTDYAIGGNVEHRIGDGYGHFDGYMARYEFVDGIALDASYFGETKNGVWIPKKYTGSYGTNGHLLEFKQTGTNADSSGLGADTSGNDNHYTPTQITGTDSNLLDCPENNFATLTSQSFPLAAKSLSEGNLKIGGTDHTVQTSSMAFPSSGKWYWEVNNLTTDGSNYYAQYMGVMSSTIFHNEQDVSSYGGGNYIGSYIRILAGVSWIAGNDVYYSSFNSTSTSNGANHATWGQSAVSTGIGGYALDVDAGTLKFYWNNSLVRTDSTLTANIEYFVTTNVTNSGGNIWSSAYYNFGQDSSFAGTKTAQGNKDGNGIGDFYYSPPSGHLALCTSNLSEPDIGPNSVTQADDHFNTVLHTANGGAGSFTGVGFKPDWIWAKNRTNGYGHGLWDTIRGVNSELQSSTTSAQITDANRLVSFDADGFSYGTSSNLYVNATSSVAWNWKAGGDIGDVSGNFIKDGVAFTPTQGTIDATAISVNTTAAFSIVKFTSDISSDVGESGTPPTIAHGLGVKPTFVIIKDLDGGSYPHWNVWHQGHQPDTTYLNYQLFLELTNASNNAGWHRTDTGFTTNLFTPPRYQYNETGKTYICYCFAEVEGYSKFGSYTGNAADNGTFVYTGFQPAWIMVKCASAGGNFTSWTIYDNKRKTFNDDVGDNSNPLYANKSAAEGERGNGTTDLSGNACAIDFLSNGFKPRDNANEINQGDVYVYMAFAEAPFKYANAK